MKPPFMGEETTLILKILQVFQVFEQRRLLTEQIFHSCLILTNFCCLDLTSAKETTGTDFKSRTKSLTPPYSLCLWQFCDIRGLSVVQFVSVTVQFLWAEVVSAPCDASHPRIDEWEVSEHILVDAVDECSVNARQPRLLVDKLFVEVAVVTRRHLQERKRKTW